jgi:secondary thiamine-phosphate synthase enzyme
MELKQITKILKYSTEKNSPINITDDVENVISNAGIKEGFCLVYPLHTTVLLIMNEYEKNLLDDFLDFMEKIIPEHNSYSHDDGNAHAHLKNILFSKNMSIPVTSGKLSLGRWQNLILIDPDGPRVREIVVKIFGV